MCVKTVCVCIYVYTYASVELVGQVVKVLDCQPLGCRFKSSPVPTRPPSCNGYLEYSGVQVHLTFSCINYGPGYGPGGTSSVHTIC